MTPFKTMITALMVLAAVATDAAAQAYPNKPIRLIVPYAAGGATDLMARSIAQKLGTGLGVQVIVDNRGGAGGNIAAEMAAKAPPDGYTLFFGATGQLVINPALYAKLNFDPMKDFAPIGLVGQLPLFLTVPATSPVNSVAELVAAVRAKPDKFNYGSSGIGGTTHLAMEMLKAHTGMSITHVPYKGTAAAVNDMLGGSLQVMFDAWATTGTHVHSGKLRFLAVSSAARSSFEPKVPTVAESGYPGFDLGVWYALLAPAGTPPDVIARLSAETAKVTAQHELKQIFATMGMEPMTSSAEQLGSFMRSEAVKWAKVVRDSGAKAE
ncbi:MAG: tripartite tricarboxylate transporter substrate binding protein [Pseudomonadota bacterium]|jgi:tripartite-type tricarboxylate transporter receptor subunit TctC